VLAFPNDLTVELTIEDSTTRVVPHTSVHSAPDEEDEPTTGIKEPPAAHYSPCIEGQLSIDWAYSISICLAKEKYYLVIHEETTDIVWPAAATSRGDPRRLIQEFMDFFGIQRLTELRFDNAWEFCHAKDFREWARLKGAILCPTVDYNHTLNSKAETYVRITKEHMRCLLRSSNAPRRLWPYAVKHFCAMDARWATLLSPI
jgi:hypothetical protein